jgi:hypothetical protein
VSWFKQVSEASEELKQSLEAEQRMLGAFYESFFEVMTVLQQAQSLMAAWPWCPGVLKFINQLGATQLPSLHGWRSSGMLALALRLRDRQLGSGVDVQLPTRAIEVMMTKHF